MDFMSIRMSINLGADNLTNCDEAGIWTTSQLWFSITLSSSLTDKSSLWSSISVFTAVFYYNFYLDGKVVHSRQRPSLVQEKSQVALRCTLNKDLCKMTYFGGLEFSGSPLLTLTWLNSSASGLARFPPSSSLAMWTRQGCAIASMK